MKHFFKFTKWGWLTVGICFASCAIMTFIELLVFKDLKTSGPKDYTIVFSIVYLVYLGFFFYHLYEGIDRIRSYKNKIKHYKRLYKIFEKRGYDPKIEYLLTTTCDKEVVKQLQKDFDIQP